MTDILTLVGGGAGVTDVTSQSSELAVATVGTTRQLTLNLSTYATNAAVSTLLGNYVLASAYNAAMASKIDSITVTAPLAISGTGTSRALSTLWKLSQVSLSTGLFGVSSDTPGTLSLSLTGAESRIALKLADSNNTVRDLTSNTSGNILWNSATLASQSWANTQLTAKEDSITELVTGSNQSLLNPTHMPSRYGAGSWTDLKTHASISFVSTVGQDHYHSPWAVGAGETIIFSMDAMFPLSGAVTNVILLWWGQWTTAAEFTSTQGLNTSTWTTISCSFTATSALNLEWGLGKTSGNTAHTQSLGSLWIRNFEIYTTTAGNAYSWATDLSINGAFSDDKKLRHCVT